MHKKKWYRKYNGLPYLLIWGDCVENLLKLKDAVKSRLIIIDPPYGSTPLKWDKVINFESLWDSLEPVRLDNSSVCIFGQEPFSSKVRLSNLKEYKYDWYWQKERLTNVMQVKRRPGKVIETISVFYKKQCRYYPQMVKYDGKPRKNKIKSGVMSITMNDKKSIPYEYIDNGTRYPIQLLEFNRDNMNNNIHPTQKPLELMKYIIKTYTKEGDLVIDPAMGSGVTGLACLELKRGFIGMDNGICERKNSKYYGFDWASVVWNRMFGNVD